jgi:hypothetical protein
MSMPFSTTVLQLRPVVVTWAQRGGDLPVRDFDLLYAAGVVDAAIERVRVHGPEDCAVRNLVLALEPRHGARLLEWLYEAGVAPVRGSPMSTHSDEVPVDVDPRVLAEAMEITRRLLVLSEWCPL